MYWDETFEAWVAFGVSSQPAAALLSADGEVLGSWRGMFPIDEVLALSADSCSPGARSLDACSRHRVGIARTGQRSGRPPGRIGERAERCRVVVVVADVTPSGSRAVQ